MIILSLSRIWFFLTPWSVALQPSLSFTISRSLLKFMFLKSVMPSNHLILCRPLLLQPWIFPTSGSFQMSQLFASGGQRIGASASVLPTNIQGWFPLGLTGFMSFLFKGLSRVFSSTTVHRKNQFFGTQPSLWSNSHICTWLLKNHSFEYSDLCRQSAVSAP